MVEAMTEAILQEVDTYVYQLLEHSRIVHCNQDHFGSVAGSGAASRVKCVQVVVGTGRLGLGRDADRDLGGGTDIVGGGDGRYG